MRHLWFCALSNILVRAVSVRTSILNCDHILQYISLDGEASMNRPQSSLAWLDWENLPNLAVEDSLLSC